MFKCGICGKEFDDIEEYLTHVSNCAVKKSEDESKKKEEELKKAKDVNSYIKAIKSYEKFANDYKKEFKKKYPNEYDMNFKEKVCSCEKEPKKESFYGSINGKECSDMDEFLKELREECEFLW